jgi:hypothetical protein
MPASRDRDRAQVMIDDFNGVIDNSDPADMPPGSAELQVNAVCRRVGLLQSRRGMVRTTFQATTLVGLTAD